MSSLVARIVELERKELALNAIQSKLSELTAFIDDWDSQDPDRLPLDHHAKINDVRRFVDFASPSKNEDDKTTVVTTPTSTAKRNGCSFNG